MTGFDSSFKSLKSEGMLSPSCSNKNNNNNETQLFCAVHEYDGYAPTCRPFTSISHRILGESEIKLARMGSIWLFFFHFSGLTMQEYWVSALPAERDERPEPGAHIASEVFWEHSSALLRSTEVLDLTWEMQGQKKKRRKSREREWKIRDTLPPWHDRGKSWSRSQQV